MEHIIRRIPPALQHAILIRVGFALLDLLAAVCLLIYFGRMLLVTPFLLLAPMLAGHAGYICWLSLKGHCLELAGTVLSVERSFLRGRPKALLLETQGMALRIILHSRLKTPEAGERILLYIPDSAPLYEWRGMHQLDSYLAIVMEGGQLDLR